MEISQYFSKASPQELSAWVAGAVALVTSFLTLIVTGLLQKKRQTHEIIIEPIKAQLAQIHENHKSELMGKLREHEHELNLKLEKHKSELQKNVDHFSATYIPQQQKVKDHLSRTRALLSRVFVSFDRLSKLAPSIKEEDVLTETTNTLDIYAEYRQHLTTDEFVSYPDDLKTLIATIQEQLSRIFLDLQVDEKSQNDSSLRGRMQNHLMTLENLTDKASEEIESLIRISIDRIA